VKQKAETLERIETEKHMKSIDGILELKIENLIQRQQIEKNGYKQKLMAEYEEMKKAKQVEIDVLIVKYKNKKLELEMKQKREKNLNENDNLLKANALSANLSNISIINNANNVNNKSFNKSSVKFSFDNVYPKTKNFIENYNLVQSINRNPGNISSISNNKQNLITNDVKTERKSSAKPKVSKHNNYETNYKNFKNKNQKLTVSEHLLKNSDLDHKKPVGMLNRRSSQTKNPLDQNKISRKFLEFNENLSSDYQTKMDKSLNFAGKFIVSPEKEVNQNDDTNPLNLEEKLSNLKYRETAEFMNKEINNNLYSVEESHFNNGIDKKLNYSHLKFEIFNNFQEKINLDNN